MTTPSLYEASYRRDLGDGLVLRWSTAADCERIIQLYSTVFRRTESDPPLQSIAVWVRDLMSGRHPLITADDFALVEDTTHGIVVACTCLLQQPAQFGDIPLMMGRPEIVATNADYRNRGLIRAIFELIHERSAARGHDFQGITGIGYYYRQFGYEYATPLGGGRTVACSDMPALKPGESEPYTLRAATPADIPLLMTIEERDRTMPRRYAGQQIAAAPLLTVPVPETYWRWTIDGTSQGGEDSWKTLIIVDSVGRDIGYVLHFPMRWGDTLGVRGLMVEAGVSLPAVLPSVLRGLQQIASELPSIRADAPPVSKLALRLLESHPVYDSLSETLGPRYNRSYAWYLRVADLPAFVRKIAPVLEQRLAQSVLNGYTGELRVDFYRGGLRLVFADGRLATADSWRTPVWEPKPNAGFPPLVFLQLVFGYRSLSAIRDGLPDAWADDDMTLLLEVLFPVQPSSLQPLD